MNEFAEFTAKMTKLESEAWDWIIRLDSEEPLSEREKSNLSEWLSRSPAHPEQLKQYNEFWSNQILVELLQPAKPKAAAARAKSAPRRLSFGPAVAFSVAAVLTVTAWLNWSTLTGWQSEQGVELALETNRYSSQVGEQQQLVLSDGTQVTLNSNSEIQTRYTENSRDVLIVRGEAHFDVHKNKQRPFNVYAANGRVQAVGTAFSIDIIDNRMEVLVTEGRIALSVSENNQADNNADYTLSETFSESLQNIAYMNAGQQVKFDASLNATNAKAELANGMRTLTPAEVDAEQAWKSGEILFRGETLKDVVAKVKRYTTLSIEIADTELESLRVGGRFKVNKLDQLLNSLQANFDIAVDTSVDGKVIIKKV
ncbi:MAG: FecR domain-containing protein [Pseudomonadota bacterium]|nr:FecR domain-containing protein [Pseudomonadota bacterium]